MPDDGARMGAAKRRQLAQRRKAVGLTQEQLAERLGVERTTVVRWERGQTQPQPWLRPRLAAALGVSADRLEELLAPVIPPGSPGPAAVPRQLPATVAGFTGRAAELAALTRILDEPGADAPGAVVISAIAGTAGMGKTTLALHWAHQVADRFGDGQLYVNLRGFDPAGTPMSTAEAIQGFLDALGVSPQRIPASAEAQAGLYRSLLADKQMLIVLDNARDEQQVRPLLPAGPGTLVLVTSRRQLSGLAAANGGRLISLGVLSEPEACQLIAARVGHARALGEPGAITQIARLCGYMPLAVTVAAARAAARPHLPIGALSDELRDAAGQLAVLDTGDPAASVRTVLSWSYQQLNPEAARMFRLLGLQSGPDISIPAAASLAGTNGPEARRILDELAHDCLITEHVPGRYVFHDMLHAYAASQAHATDDGQDRREAIGRILDYYLHTSHAAALLLNPTCSRLALALPRLGVKPEELTDCGQAMAWFEAERHVLLAAITVAAEKGFDVHAWQIPRTMTTFLARRGHWQQWLASQCAAVAAATRLGNAAAQAEARLFLAAACTNLGDYDQARSHQASSLELYQRLGNRLGEANTRQNLGALAARQGRYADALRHAEQALRIYEAIGEKVPQAGALNDVGWYHGLLGDYQQARVFCRQSVALCAETGDSWTEGLAWDSVAYAEHHLGNHAEAAACYQRALALLRQASDRFSEAGVLARLGDTRQAAGEPAQALEAWQQALVVFEDLLHPEADQVRAKLASANGR